MQIIDEIKTNRLYLDGGMGSMIQKRIADPGPIP